MPASQQPSLPKRELLLETAFQLFYRDGYHAVGIDRILAEAGVAKMTLYNHFKSKDELIVAVLERRGAQVRANREALLAKAGTDPRKRLDAIFDGYAAWFKTPDFNGCAFIRAIGEYPDLQYPAHQAAKAEKEKLVETLQALLKEIGAASASKLARQLLLLIEGAIVTAHTFGDPNVARQARDAAWALIENAGVR